MRVKKVKNTNAGALLFMLFFLANFFLYNIIFLIISITLFGFILNDFYLSWTIGNIVTIGIIYLSIRSATRFFFKLYTVENPERMKSITAFLFFVFSLISLVFYYTIEYALFGLLGIIIDVPIFYIILNNQVDAYNKVD